VAITSTTTIILAGDSLSAPVDTANGITAALIMPADFEPANLTFQISADGITFADLFDGYGNEVMMACRPGTGVRVKDGIGSTLHLKIRSGTRDHPVPQSADRTFTVILA